MSRGTGELSGYSRKLFHPLIGNAELGRHPTNMLRETFRREGLRCKY